MTDPSVIDVAAGLVFRGGRLLITQRHASSHLGGLWEFPGGKREPGEDFPQCLKRELREELGIEIEVGELLETVLHTYPEKTVRLMFYHCRWKLHEPRTLGCPAFAWIARHEIDLYEFPAADARILGRIKQGSSLWDA